MIPQETVDLILDTARIEDVIGDFVSLKRRGANLVACCPFHNEKTPSFYVSPSKGIYKCFGCGKAGSAVGFLMEYEHSSYTEALRYLARKYHIEIQEEEESAEDIAYRQRRESLMLVSDFAEKFFAEQLKEGEGRSVGYAYYRNRGLEDETIAKWGLGWAPSGRTALIDAAKAAGYKMEYLVGAGLAVEREDGSLADKFRERVMFPIHSVSGRVIAFSGRTLHADNPAKYVNSPETEIYVKSRNLLGIYFAKSEISRLGKCILVEGNMDVVMMHQLGIRNVVASCGTSLTVEQLRLIHKFTDDLTIMYDGDSAGIHAALRGTDLALAEGLNVRIILLPDGEDPDSFSKTHTLEQVQAYMEQHEQDFVSFKTDLLLKDAAGDPLKKAALINDIADTIAEIPDAVKRSVYVESVSQKFNIESSILFNRISDRRQKKISDAREEALRAARRQEASSSEAVQPQPVESGASAEDLAIASLETDRIVAPVERDLLYFLLNYGSDQLHFESDSEFYVEGEELPTVTDFIAGAIESDGGTLLNPAYQKVYASYLEAYDAGHSQEEIIRSMFNSPDRQISFVTAQLSIEKYRLTVKSFEESLTTKDSWLVSRVPKLILMYMDKKLESRLDALRREMADPGNQDRILDLMNEMVRLQKLQKSVKEKMNK